MNKSSILQSNKKAHTVHTFIQRSNDVYSTCTTPIHTQGKENDGGKGHDGLRDCRDI